MLKRFLPRQENFFVLFQKTADIIVKTAKQYFSMLHDLDNIHTHVDIIAIHEREADEVAQLTFELLHKTFITPFDRYDIHQLASGLDDILDRINRCAQSFPFYRLNRVTPEIIIIAELGIRTTEILRHAIYRLNALTKPREIIQLCEEIDDVENKAHQSLLLGVQNLFNEESDFKQFIKLKDIYTQSKSFINGCQDVGNIIKGIVLEYC